MLRILSPALILVAALLAIAGVVYERRAGKWRPPKATYVVLLTALLLGATAAALFLIAVALE